MLTCVCLMQPAIAYADASESRAPGLYMAADVLIARPALLALTLVGTALYVVSLPFSVIGGNTAEAAEVLVAGPARATFTRCLGCVGSD